MTSGFSKYPDAIDDQSSLPVSVDLVTPVNAEVVNRLRDAIIAIESELGADPSREFGTLRARVDALQAEINAINAELGINPSGTFDTVVERLRNIDIELSRKAEIPILANQIDASQRITIPLVLTEQVSIDTFTAIGGDNFDPSTIPDPGAPMFPTRKITFVARLYTSSASIGAQIRLFNVTDGTAVASTVLTSTSVIPENQSVVLAVPADLPNSEKSYEVQLRNTSGSSTTAFCQKAEFIITWS